MSLLPLLALMTTSARADDDLLAGVPEGFPHFQFPGHDHEAQLMTRYLWYHFSTRLGNQPVLFNKEYLALADTWLAGAVDPKRGPIQEVHKADLTFIKLSDDGYVHTHQHWSHANDYGWPFPLWPQVPGPWMGVTAGFHFQEDGTGWLWDIWLRPWKPQGCLQCGKAALDGWELSGLESSGLKDNRWQLRATGPSPTLTTPERVTLDAYNCPFLQLRWIRTGTPHNQLLPYVEWLRDGDRDYGPDRRVYFDLRPGLSDLEGVDGTIHSMIDVYRHPLWTGKIKRVRINLAPGDASGLSFAIDSFFTAYDTRHTINNPIYILASWDFFRWTGDVEFLRAQANKMRRALRYQQVEMGGLEFGHIRNGWIGHDGRPSYTIKADGSKTYHSGHGLGSNYWDLLPFGWDDLYATNQYYASILALAEMEEAIRANPGWDVPLGGEVFDPATLRREAARVKQVSNKLFWDKSKGRFVGCIDADGVAHDYGFTFLNLDAIWYGLASDEHAKEILQWLSGERIVKGDTSTGADIYHWRFGPRATTLRNLDWYGQGWTAPESIPWGGQVQDGGAVLGFSFYDLWARLKVRGADDAWKRLTEILAWEDDVRQGGGYRKFYADGKQGTTLQGGGTAGGIGIDAEFYESCLLPCIVTYGFLGVTPEADGLAIRPNLPAACPGMSMANLLYRGCRFDVKVGRDAVEVTLKDQPLDALRIKLDGDWRIVGKRSTASTFDLAQPGTYKFRRL